MIKTVILGGSTPVAGELIRILINHTDIDIVQVQSAENPGRAVADVHTGLIGETDLRMSLPGEPANCDVIFVCDFSPVPAHADDTRVVCFFPPEGDNGAEYVYGLPELNRKALVRGATHAVIPSAQAMLCALGLLPLAKNLLLPGEIDIHLDIPSTITDYDVAEELVRAISSLQNAFSGKINISTSRNHSDRVMSVRIELPTTVDIGEISRLYEEFYDDHRFTYLINRTPSDADVEGTNKCLIHLDKQDGNLIVEAAYDAVVKGNAGTAVHCMNLLFGLHELTGLQLKASRLSGSVGN